MEPVGGEAIGPEHQAGLGERIEEAAAKKFLMISPPKSWKRSARSTARPSTTTFRTSTTCCAGFWSMRLQRRCGGGLLAGRPAGRLPLCAGQPSGHLSRIPLQRTGPPGLPLFSLARAITASTLAESARTCLPERELDFLADFYMYAIAGMMMGWLSDDMREEPEGDRAGHLTACWRNSAGRRSFRPGSRCLES